MKDVLRNIRTSKIFKLIMTRKGISAILGIVVVSAIILYNVFPATAASVTMELLPQPDAGLNSTGTVWANWNYSVTGGTWTNSQGYTTAGWYVTTDSFDPTGTAIGSWRSYRANNQTTSATASSYHTFTVPAGYNSEADTLETSFYWKKLIGTAAVTTSNVKWQILSSDGLTVMGSGTLNGTVTANTNIDWTKQTINLKTGLTTPVSAGITYRLWLGHESRTTATAGSTTDVAFDVARVALTSTQVPTTVSVTASKSPIVDDNVDSSTITANVDDQFGNPINNQTVDFTRDPAIGSLSSSTATTDSSGNASVTFKGNNDGGEIVTITAAADSVSGDTSVALARAGTIANNELLPQPDAGLNSTGTVWANWNQSSTTGYTVNQGYTTAGWYVTTDSFDPTGTAIGSWRTYMANNQTTARTVSIYHTFTVPAGYNSAVDTLEASFYWKKLIGTANVTTSNVGWQVVRNSDSVVMGSGTLNSTVTANTSVDWTKQTIDLKTGLTTPVSAGITYRLLLSHNSQTTATAGSTSDVAFDVARVKLTAMQVPTTVTVTASKTPIADDNVDSSTITANVDDQFGNPINNQTVDFTRDPAIGSLSSSTATTDSSGNASVTFKGNNDGGEIVTITAAADSVSGDTSVALARAGTIADKELLPQPDAGLNSTGTVWANWNQASSGTGWTLSQGYTTAGWYVTTDSFDPTGTAIGSWRTSRAINGANGTASIYHTFTVPAGYDSAIDTLQASFYWKKLIGTTAVTASNVSWEIVRNSDSVVMGSGTINSAVTANTNIDWTKQTIDLKTGLTTPVSAGITYRLLLSHQSTTPNTAGATVAVAFDVARATLTSMQVPTTVSVSASKSPIENDNVDSSTITANVTDRLGDPINNLTVSFTRSPDKGYFTPSDSATTDASGNASVTFKSNDDLRYEVTITAAVGSVSGYTTVNITTPWEVQTELLPQPDAGLNSTGTVWANWNYSANGGTWTNSQGYTTAGWYVTTDSFDPTGTAIGSWRTSRAFNQNTLQTASSYHTFTVPAGYNSQTDTLEASFYWKKLIGTAAVTTSNVKWQIIRNSDSVVMGSGTLNSAVTANTSVNWTKQTINLKTGLTTPVSANTTYQLWLGHESRTPNTAGATSDVAFDVARVTLTEEKRPTVLTLSPSPASIPDDNTTTSTITAHLHDQLGNPLSGQQINFTTDIGTLSAANAVTNASGDATVTIKSATAGTANITGTVNNKTDVTDTINVVFTEPTTVTMSASSTKIPNNNSTTTTITAHVHDQNGDPINGLQVNFSKDVGSGTLSAASANTDANGNAVITFKSDTGSIVTITGTANRAPNPSNTVAVTVQAPTTLTVSASPASIPNDNVSTSTITGHLDDQYGNPINAEQINFSTNLGTLSAASATTNSSGNATVTVKSATAGTATITGTVNRTPGVTNNTAVAIIVPTPTTITLTPSLVSVVANDTIVSTITAHLDDQIGNPVNGQVINFSTNLGTLSSATASTNASGNAIVTIKSGTAGTAMITGTVDSKPSVNGPTSVLFEGPVPTTFILTASPVIVASDNTQMFTVTAHLVDQSGVGLSGQRIDFSATLGTLSASNVNTNAGGDAIVTVKSEISGVAIIRATVNSKPSLWQFKAVEFAIQEATPPTLLSAEATSKQIIYLTFSEPIQNPNNYGSITISGLGIISINLMDDCRTVRLTVNEQACGNQYQTPNSYTVSVEDIKDISDNVIVPNPTTLTFDAFTPHGKYSPDSFTSNNSTRMCGQCHLTHSAVGSELLSGTTIKKVCFVCHGTAGISVYKVEKEFYNWDNANVGTSVYSASIHKSLDSDSPGYNVLTCTDCHDPHGTRRPGTNDIYPKLLRAENVNGTVYTTADGNWFCLACHAFGEQTRFGSYWSITGGTHDWGMTVASNVYYGVHYDNRLSGLQPASGTNVTCVKCHERHGSTYGSLKDHSRTNAEEDQCYKCHGKDANYSMTVSYNVYNKITTSVSQHKVGSTTYGKVECSSCHGPHSVANAKYNTNKAYSAISDPDNTKNPFTMSAGRFSQFCLKCHDSSAPSATTSSTVIIPYTISFSGPSPGFTSNGGGWNKDAPLSYTASGHYNNTTLRGQTDTYGNYKNECSLCHEWHGTDYKWLVNKGEDTSATGETAICLQCHGPTNAGSFTKPASITSLDVKTPLGYSFAHPSIAAGYSGRHSNTEQWPWNTNGVSRHAQCYDCHDPHTANGNTGSEIDRLGNISGVKFSQTAWDSWASATATHVDLDPTTNNRQAYLCYKCHSKYAGNQPSTTPGSASGYTPGAFAQTDVAKEFNPSNKARHVVEGTSQMPTYVSSGTRYYGAFVNGWTATSPMKCTDCHMPASGAKGPHGSTVRFILRAAWTPTQSATMTSSDLCFLCHSYNFYYSGSDGGSTTNRSQFSSGTNYNLHASDHRSGKQKNCSNCHGGLPHGWKYTDSGGGGQALWSSTDARPYKDGSYLGDIPTNCTRVPGNWSGQHSGTSCGNTGSCT